jgi:hypothetical protein
MYCMYGTDLHSTGTSTALFIEHTALVIATNRVPQSSRQRGEGDTVGVLEARGKRKDVVSGVQSLT